MKLIWYAEDREDGGGSMKIHRDPCITPRLLPAIAVALSTAFCLLPAAAFGDFWHDWGQMLMPMKSGQSATVGNYQFVMGGLNGEGQEQRRVDRCDVVSRSWSEMESMPLGICNGVAAAIGDTVYLHGGFSYAEYSLINRLYKYSISTNTWTSDTGCCLFNWEPSMLAFGGKLYYMGGSDQPGSESRSVQTWCYTPGDSPCWVRKADMHTGRVFAHAGVHDGKIYMAGGDDGNMNGIRETEFYDPERDVWTQDSIRFPYLPRPRGMGAGGCAGNTMFIYGGMSQGAYDSSVLEYDFTVRKWDTVPGAGCRYLLGCGAVIDRLGQGVVFGVRYYLRAVCKQFEFTRDAGVIRIVSPSGDVDSGDALVPSAWVRNFESMPGHLRVVMRIGPSYTRYDSLDVLPGESLLVRFPSWTASSSGLVPVRCSTLLDNDSVPENDAAVDTIRVSVNRLTITEILSPPETCPAGPLVAAIRVRNSGEAARSCSARFIFLKDDTLPVELDSVQVIDLPPSGERDLAFSEFQAEPGRYLARFILISRAGRTLDSAVRRVTVIVQAVEEPSRPLTACRSPLTATIINGILRLPLASGVKRKASSVLLDISGRKVLALKPGANDVSRLGVGVYFISERVAGGSRQAEVKKIVIAR